MWQFNEVVDEVHDDGAVGSHDVAVAHNELEDSDGVVGVHGGAAEAHGDVEEVHGDAAEVHGGAAAAVHDGAVVQDCDDALQIVCL